MFSEWEDRSIFAGKRIDLMARSREDMRMKGLMAACHHPLAHYYT
jgi:hypothetical protein